MVCGHVVSVFGSHFCSDFCWMGVVVEWIKFTSLRVGSFAKSTETFLAASLVLATMFRAFSRFTLPTMALCGSHTKFFAFSDSQW